MEKDCVKRKREKKCQPRNFPTNQISLITKLLEMICPGKVILVLIQLILFIVAGINCFELGKELMVNDSHGDIYRIVFPGLVFVTFLLKLFVLPIRSKLTTSSKEVKSL